MTDTPHHATGPGLPPGAFIFIPTNEPGRRIGFVKKGAKGYTTTTVDSHTLTPRDSAHACDQANTRLNVTRAQAKAMRTGALIGWSTPGALDPGHPDNSGGWL